MLRHVLRHGGVSRRIVVDAAGDVVRIAGPVGTSRSVQGAVVEAREGDRRAAVGRCGCQRVGDNSQHVGDDRGLGISVSPPRRRRVPYRRRPSPGTRSALQHAGDALQEGVRGRRRIIATTAQADQIAAERGGERARQVLPQRVAVAMHPTVLLRRSPVLPQAVVRDRRIIVRLRPPPGRRATSTVQPLPYRGVVRGCQTPSPRQRFALGVPPTHIREAVDRSDTAHDNPVVGDHDEIPARGLGSLPSRGGGAVREQRRG